MRKQVQSTGQAATVSHAYFLFALEYMFHSLTDPTVCGSTVIDQAQHLSKATSSQAVDSHV